MGRAKSVLLVNIRDMCGIFRFHDANGWHLSVDLNCNDSDLILD